MKAVIPAFTAKKWCVAVVALSIESLASVVEALHRDPDDRPPAASVATGAAALLAAGAALLRLGRHSSHFI
jgi:hypothetical protein